MGWMRTLLLGDIGNHMDIQDNTRSIEYYRESIAFMRSKVYKNEATDVQQDKNISEMNLKIEQLQLALSLVVGSLKNKGTFSDAEVERLVELLDED